MALEKTPVSWPITGGIATKNAPIMLAPGSNLVLDNVRQERLNEWRTRPGNTKDAADAVPGAVAPVLLTEAPWGGLVGLVRQTTYGTAGRAYSPGAGTRWITPPVDALGAAGCSQLGPGVWTRRAVAPFTPNGLLSPTLATTAEGGNYRLSAWWASTVAANTGIQVCLQTSDGATVQQWPTYNSDGAACRPRCVYSAASGMLVLVYQDGANQIIAVRWSATTGALVGTTTISAAAYAGAVQAAYVDARDYGGATVTIVFRNNTAAGQLQIVEFNPSTAAVASNVNTGLDCSNNLALFSDPDASGIRMVGIVNVLPETRVIRLNSVGAVQTNHLVEAVDSLALTGCAYNAGVDWMCVYNPTLFNLKAVKRRSGVTSGAVNLVTAGRMYCGIAAGAWREAGTDAMRYMIRGDGAQALDVQPTFLELALEFENASAAISNTWTEPQARLLSLNAGSTVARGCVPQVFRLAADKFVAPLARITRQIDVGASVDGQTFEIDSWTVQYLNSTTYTNQNLGQGTKTLTTSFLLAGTLLQTATGQLLCSHGASAVPFLPVLTPSVGAGTLNPAKTYTYGVNVIMPDEAGNDWRSPMSLTAELKPGGANNTITVDVKLTPLENQQRRRIVQLWRTDGDGSELKLLFVVQGTVAQTGSFSYVDINADPAAGGGELRTAELEAALTPAMRHVTLWNGRLWGVDRDFPTLVRFSKPLTAGLLPEFPDEFVCDTGDAEGELTGLAPMDDKIVALKKSAIYVAAGDGPENNGSGQAYKFLRIDSETGAIAGSPVLSTGAEVYMVAEGGVYVLNRSQQVQMVDAIDQYLSMPRISAPETVTGMVLSPSNSEVRVQTTHYRFVHDRIFNAWYRDTGGFGSTTIVMTRMVGSRQVFITSTGDMWYEATDAGVPDDAGAAYKGIIRSPWIRPTGVGGWLRLYRVRLLDSVTEAGVVGAQQLTIFFDDSDSLFEQFTPSTSLNGAIGTVRGEARPKRQKCTSFSLQLELPSSNATVRLEEWWAVVGAKAGAPPPATDARWLVVEPIPGPPAPTPIPVPARVFTIYKLVGQRFFTGGLSTVRKGQADILVQVLAQFFATGFWACVRSCDGATISATNLWTDQTKVTATSWMQMRNTVTGVQYVGQVTAAGNWLEVTWYSSASAGFTGGNTAGVRPTATDEQLNSSIGGADWLGTDAGAGTDPNPGFRAWVWVSSDGLDTRVCWTFDFQDGRLAFNAFWTFQQITYPAGGTWVPWFTWMFQNGTGYNNPSNKMTLGTFDNWPKKARTPAAVNEDIFHAFEKWGGTFLVDLQPQNQATLQYVWTGPPMLALSGVASPRNGAIGYMSDFWFVGSVGGVTPVMPEWDTAGNRAILFIDSMMLPWDGTPVPGVTGSVDHAATQFFGRSAA